MTAPKLTELPEALARMITDQSRSLDEGFALAELCRDYARTTAAQEVAEVESVLCEYSLRPPEVSTADAVRWAIQRLDARAAVEASQLTGDNAEHVRVLRNVMWCATTEEAAALDAAIAALSAPKAEAVEGGLTEDQKVERDVYLYGTGFMRDGKHIPAQEVVITTNKAGPVEGGPKDACYSAYQAVGVMLSDLGIFDTERGQNLLDNLSQARMVHDVLPWPSVKPESGGQGEAVAVRYDGDGYGYRYIDSGSGSDWLRRHKDGEPLYTHPPASGAVTLLSFAERIEQAEPWLHKGARFTKWAKDLAADMREAAAALGRGSNG